jgi:hypothetical protein
MLLMRRKIKSSTRLKIYIISLQFIRLNIQNKQNKYRSKRINITMDENSLTLHGRNSQKKHQQSLQLIRQI